MGLGNDGPVQLDRFTDPISPKTVLHLQRLLRLRTSSGGILQFPLLLDCRSGSFTENEGPHPKGDPNITGRL